LLRGCSRGSKTFQVRLKTRQEEEGGAEDRARVSKTERADSSCHHSDTTPSAIPAMLSKLENRKGLKYASFATACNVQKHPTAHS
jgi:hypothetical protein